MGSPKLGLTVFVDLPKFELFVPAGRNLANQAQVQIATHPNLPVHLLRAEIQDVSEFAGQPPSATPINHRSEKVSLAPQHYRLSRIARHHAADEQPSRAATLRVLHL